MCMPKPTGDQPILTAATTKTLVLGGGCTGFDCCDDSVCKKDWGYRKRGKRATCARQRQSVACAHKLCLRASATPYMNTTTLSPTPECWIEFDQVLADHDETGLAFHNHIQ